MPVAITTDLSEISNFDILGDPTTVGARWKKWKRSFEVFAVGKEVQNAAWRKALFLHCGGPQTQDVYSTLLEALEPGDSETVNSVAMEKLDQYFTPKLMFLMRDIWFGLWLSYLMKALISLLQDFQKGQITVNSSLRRLKIFVTRLLRNASPVVYEGNSWKKEED